MQISNDWFVAETEFENKSFIIRETISRYYQAIGKIRHTYRSRMGISGR